MCMYVYVYMCIGSIEVLLTGAVATGTVVTAAAEKSTTVTAFSKNTVSTGLINCFND